MSNSFQLIEGGIHTDERGTIAFANTFDLAKIRRFYRITHPDTNIIRAWQGHQKESKWFHCLSGQFLVQLVKIDDWQSPSSNLPCKKIILDSSKSQVLFIPPGYANGFQALQPESSLMVFSDATLEESTNDDYRFNENYWAKWNTL